MHNGLFVNYYLHESAKMADLLRKTRRDKKRLSSLICKASELLALQTRHNALSMVQTMSKYDVSIMNYKYHVVVKRGMLRLATVSSDQIILIYQVVLVIGVRQIFCSNCNSRWLDCQPRVVVQPPQVLTVGTRAVCGTTVHDSLGPVGPLHQVAMADVPPISSTVVPLCFLLSILQDGKIRNKYNLA